MTHATLELALEPEDAPRLWRHPAVQALGAGRQRGTALSILWHDTADGALARDGLALAERRGTWSVERLVRGEDDSWPPGMPAPVLREGPGPDALGLDGAHVAIAAFAGRRRAVAPPVGAEEAEAEGITLTLVEGTIKALREERRCARLALAGPPGTLAGLAEQLMGEFRLRVPEASLAAEALGLARGSMPEPPLGAPEIPAGLTVADAFARIAGHLTGVILHWSGRAAAGESAEPVHQMRVAVRRLRSAFAVFRPAIAGPTFNRLQGELRDLAARLGAARDWDVFLEDTAAPVQEAFENDRRLKRLADAAHRRRALAYAALGDYLAGPRFRLLALHLAGLAALRLWEGETTAEQSALLAEDAAVYAARLLDQRRRKMLKAGKRVASLPTPELHELRKRGKKLRYACEFFSPLYPPKPTKRFLRRLAQLQESLGHLNDGATAATLMAELGPGRDRAFATGAIQGYLAAHSTNLRDSIQQTWTKFRTQPPFWA
jgi:triphosphatase